MVKDVLRSYKQASMVTDYFIKTPNQNNFMAFEEYAK